MSNVYRKAGSLEYFARLESGDGAREVALGTSNLRTALRLCAELGGAEAGVRAEVVRPRAKPQTAGRAANGILPGSVHHALAYYLQRGSPDLADATRKLYTQKGQQLARLLGDVPLRELSRGQLDEYIAKRRKEGVQLETVRKELTVLRLALKLARDLGEFERDPERVLPTLRVKYKPRRRWLPVEEVQALLAQLQPARQLWVLVIVYTSARFSEARRLTWEAIDFKQGLVHIEGTKTDGAERFVPLHPELRKALLAARKSSGVVLKSWVSALRDLKAACKRAGIEKATFNDLRRTYSSWLKQAGVESFVVAKLLGHTTTKMVELVYGHLSSDVFERAVEKLPSLTLGKPEKPVKLKKGS